MKYMYTDSEIYLLLHLLYRSLIFFFYIFFFFFFYNKVAVAHVAKTLILTVCSRVEPVKYINNWFFLNPLHQTGWRLVYYYNTPQTFFFRKTLSFHCTQWKSINRTLQFTRLQESFSIQYWFSSFQLKFDRNWNLYIETRRFIM